MTATPRRVVAVALVAVGAYLLVLPFALSLFTRTAHAEKLADRYRAFATDEGLAQFAEHTDIVVRGGRQLLDEVLPTVDDDGFPNVAVYRERAPEVFAYLEPAVAAVAAQADNVSEADDFPAPGVPVTVGPWALLGAGLVLIGVGLTRRPAGTVVALVAGVGLAAGPFVLGWPSKVAAAAGVAEAARGAFTPEVARATTADTYMIDAAVVELHQLLADVDLDDFPDAAAFLAAWDAELSPNAHDISQSQIQFMDEFHDADATPYRALPWLVVVPGVVLLGAAVAARVR